MRGDLLALGAMGALALAGAARQGSGNQAVSDAALEAGREIEKLLKSQAGLWKVEDWIHSPRQDFLVMTMKWRRPSTRKSAKSEARAALEDAGFKELDDKLGRTIFHSGIAKVCLYDYPDMIEVELKEVGPRLTLAADYGVWANEKRRGMLSFWEKQVSKGSKAVSSAATRKVEQLAREIEQDPALLTSKPFLEYDEFDLTGEGPQARAMGDDANLLCFFVTWVEEGRKSPRKTMLSSVKKAMARSGFTLVTPDVADLEGHLGGSRVLVWDNGPRDGDQELKVVFTHVQARPLLSGADAGPWVMAQASKAPKRTKKLGSRALAPAATRMLERLRSQIRKDPNVEAYEPFLEYDETDSIGERQDPSDQMSLDSRMADHASLICFDVGWVGEPRRDAKRYTKASLKRAISAVGFKLFKPGAAELEGLLGEARVLVWENDPWDNRDGEFKVVLTRVQAKPLLSGADAGPWARAQQIPKVQKKTKKLGSRAVSDAARRMMEQISNCFKADPAYRLSRWDVPSRRPFASPVDRDDEVSLAFDWNPVGKNLENVNDWEWMRDHAVGAASAKLLKLGFAQISGDTHGAFFKKGRAEARLWWIRHGLSLHLYDVEPKHTLGGDKGAWARAEGTANRQGSRTVSPAAQEMMEILTSAFNADRRYEVSEWSSGPKDGSMWSSKRRLGLRWWSVEGDVDSRRQAAMRDVQHRLKQLGFRVASVDLGSCDFELHGAFLQVTQDRHGDLDLWLYDPEPNFLLGGDSSIWAQAKRLSGGFRASR